MPITTDLSDPVGQIRLLIGDLTDGDGVKPKGENFTDEELQYFFQTSGTVPLAAGMACETLAHLWNLYPDFDADGLRMAGNQIALGWWRAALKFKQSAPATTQTMHRSDDDAA